MPAGDGAIEELRYDGGRWDYRTIGEVPRRYLGRD
jgi:hypothetical protein